MTYTFCTLFDKNYIYRGLALHNSLMNVGIEFGLYILCLDSETFEVLTRLHMPNVTLLVLKDVEDEEVLRAKENRSQVEYYWTLASVLTYYVLEKYPAILHVAYLDSDIFFFSSPESLYKELDGGSVLIIRHNYSPELRYLEKRSGIYNVGLVVFKNDQFGMACLAQWKADCLRWCYNRLEEGKFGDQMYLDSWPSSGRAVRVLQNPGGGVAPWNVAQYALSNNSGVLTVDSGYPLVFFHFHTLRMVGPGHYVPHSKAYRFDPLVYTSIYEPYFASLTKVIGIVQSHFPDRAFGFVQPESMFSQLRNILKRCIVHLRFKLTSL